MNAVDELRLQAGGTLNPRRHIYIRRPHDDRLLELLLEGQYVNVLASRQMGKSSLMMRTILDLRERGVQYASMDLGAELGSCVEAEPYYLGLIGKIARSLNLRLDVPAWWQDHDHETFNQRLLRFFREPVAETVEEPIVIFLDEIDSTLKLAFTDDLFVAMRGMYNERTLVPAYERISFCLLGVATPNELVKHRRTTAYNVGYTLELDDFDRAVEDLTPIAHALSGDAELGNRLLDRVLYWTGGHPYLSVKMCVDLKAAGASSEAEVDRHVNETYGRLDRMSPDADVHFQQILRFVADRFSDSLATFDLYERILNGKRERDQTTLTHAELKLSGLVKRNARGLLVVRNRIYARLFDHSWVASSKPRRELARYRQWAVAASLLLLIAIGGMVSSFWLWSNEFGLRPFQGFELLLHRTGLYRPAWIPEMVSVGPGDFQMGSTESPSYRGPNTVSSEFPQHTVSIPRPFKIGKYEVTFEEYDAFVEATPGTRRPDDSGWGRGRRPVINVSWDDAQAYARWLSAITGDRYRLPTEAEWEYTARAGTSGRYWWCDEFEPDCAIKPNVANCSECESTEGIEGIGEATVPVGSFAANSFGLHDTAGNVWEWVQDCWHASYSGAPDDGTAWEAADGGDCTWRVFRGGSWSVNPWLLRSAFRLGNSSGYRSIFIGLRLAHDLD